jgi:hypothetical protein
VAGAPGWSAAVVTKQDGRRHIVVLCASKGTTFRPRNYSLVVGSYSAGLGSVVVSNKKPPVFARAAVLVS